MQRSTKSREIPVLIPFSQQLLVLNLCTLGVRACAYERHQKLNFLQIRYWLNVCVGFMGGLQFTSARLSLQQSSCHGESWASSVFVCVCVCGVMVIWAELCPAEMTLLRSKPSGFQTVWV